MGPPTTDLTARTDLWQGAEERAGAGVQGAWGVSPQIRKTRLRAVLPRKDVRRGRRVEGLFSRPLEQEQAVATITVVVGEAPYGSQRVYTALRFSLVALHEEHKANLFLVEDGVFAAKAGQQPPEMPVGDAGMPNCEALISAAIQEGLTVKACRVCCLERGLKQEEIVSGVEIGSMLDLLNWVLESDKTLFF